MWICYANWKKFKMWSWMRNSFKWALTGVVLLDFRERMDVTSISLVYLLLFSFFVGTQALSRNQPTIIIFGSAGCQAWNKQAAIRLYWLILGHRSIYSRRIYQRGAFLVPSLHLWNFLQDTEQKPKQKTHSLTRNMDRVICWLIMDDFE